MRIYELIFICKPDLPEEEVNAQTQAIQDIIESGGGKVSKVEQWGKKKLAYKVQKVDHGFYVFFEYSVEENSALPKEIERRLRVAEPVIKFMTVRIDEELKRAEKTRLKREKRLARKPAPAPRPSAPKPAAPEAPGEPDGDEKAESSDESPADSNVEAAGEENKS
jgi:small subunit ribosomal protein S6